MHKERVLYQQAYRLGKNTFRYSRGGCMHVGGCMPDAFMYACARAWQQEPGLLTASMIVVTNPE